jgi:hypothetical protein
VLILQFVAMRGPAVTARLIRSSRQIPSTVILDLEDGLWDVTDASAT